MGAPPPIGHTVMHREEPLSERCTGAAAGLRPLGLLAGSVPAGAALRDFGRRQRAPQR